MSETNAEMFDASSPPDPRGDPIRFYQWLAQADISTREDWLDDPYMAHYFQLGYALTLIVDEGTPAFLTWWQQLPPVLADALAEEEQLRPHLERAVREGEMEMSDAAGALEEM